MIYLQLFWEFLKIGLFAVGGGMATLPFLQRLSESTGWFPQSLITDMIAISESTPGPIGINMATYVGCNVAGFLGGIVATMGEILPAIVIVVTVSRYLEKFRGSKLVDAAFYGLRPAVTGLIAAAGISVVQVSMFHLALYQQTGVLMDLFDVKKIVFFAVAFAAIKKFKLHPIIYIAAAAVVGIMLSF
ncbi:chromate transporter [Dysosmobacter sp.]